MLFRGFMQSKLFNDGNNSTGTYGTAALADSETKALLHSYGMNQLYSHLYVVARHAHLSSSRKLAYAGNVSCSEVELRTVVVEERSVTTTLVLGQNVHLSGELVMALYGTGFNKALTSLDLVSLNATKKSTDVITSLSLVK